MKTFDWEEFICGGVMVHCSNEDKANDFLKQAHKRGLIPNVAESLLEKNYYNVYCTKILSSGHLSDWQRNNYKIVEWSDYMFTNEDLKVGMLVETSIGGGIVMPSSSELVVIYEDGNWSLINFSDVNKVYGYSNDPCFAMSYSSFHRDLLYERPTAKEMTVEEISKALGYDVKVVKGE